MKLHVQPIYFEAMKSGKKRVEGRIATPKYRALKKGDIITFISDSDESLKRTVLKTQFYPSFKAGFQYVSFSKLIPAAKTFQEAIEAYRKFYTEKEEIANGVIFIFLK